MTSPGNCPNCGTKNPKKNRFCMKCGTELPVLDRMDFAQDGEGVPSYAFLKGVGVYYFILGVINIIAGIGFGIYSFVEGDTLLGIMGFAAALIFSIPFLVAKDIIFLFVNLGRDTRISRNLLSKMLENKLSDG